MSSSRQDSLSAVMIAGPDDRYLRDSLASLRPIADEIIFINTGARPAAVETARELGCLISDFPWGDDFSQAKNFGISKATGRWILSVDSDEVLQVDQGPPLLARALCAPATPAYLLFQDNLYDAGVSKPNLVLRLFQNDPRLRFVNPVHECISPTLCEGWPGFFPPVLPVRLKHFGYLPENVSGKHARNIRILKKWVTTAPDCIFANFKLGNTLMEVGQKDEALHYLEKTYRLFARSSTRFSAPFLPAFAIVFHQALLEAGLNEQAERFDRTACGWIKVLFDRFPQLAPAGYSAK